MVISREADNFKRASRDVSEYLHTKEWCLKCKNEYYPDNHHTLYMCWNTILCMCAGYVYVSASAEETRGVESFVARITGCWYLPDMGARNPIWVLCKSGTYFKPLSHLSSPQADNLNLIPGNHMAGENQLPQAILLHSHRYTVCLPLLLYVIKNIKQHKNIRSAIYTHFKIHHYPKNKIQWNSKFLNDSHIYKKPKDPYRNGCLLNLGQENPKCSMTNLATSKRLRNKRIPLLEFMKIMSQRDMRVNGLQDTI